MANRIFKWTSVASLALVFLSTSGLAQVKSPPLDFTIHQEYTSTRALGMGNAFTAVADDFSALFYNPAALAFRKDGHLRMFLRAGFSADYRDLVDDLQAASKLGSEADEATRITDVLAQAYGEGYYSRIPTLGSVWVRPNWGLAVLPIDLSVDMTVHQQVTPAINVTAYGDTTFAYGRAKKLSWFGDNYDFAMGVTAKALHRVYVGESLGVAQIASDAELIDRKSAGEGMTIDLDVGSMLVPNWRSGLFRYAKPTFAAVVRNTLDYGFPIQFDLIGENSSQPPKLQRRIDLGSNWDLPKFWVFDPHFSLDVRDILHTNWTPKKGLHVGAELFWQMFSWWKGHWSVGLNQGYPTLGFGARLGIFQLDLATWGEEAGTDDVPVESRRYVFEMSLDF